MSVALISGSGRGIGRATALIMAERGADIVVHDIDGVAVDALVAEIVAIGRRAHRAVFDITDASAVRAMTSAAEAALGRIDILVNNAGIPGGEIAFQAIDEAV